jgi:hypothetical protein
MEDGEGDLHENASRTGSGDALWLQWLQPSCTARPSPNQARMASSRARTLIGIKFAISKRTPACLTLKPQVLCQVSVRSPGPGKRMHRRQRRAEVVCGRRHWADGMDSTAPSLHVAAGVFVLLNGGACAGSPRKALTRYVGVVAAS